MTKYVKSEKRVDCYTCERRILLRYNPAGYCRKCLRKHQHRVIKLDAKLSRLG